MGGRRLFDLSAQGQRHPQPFCAHAQRRLIRRPAPQHASGRVVFLLVPSFAEAVDRASRRLRIELLDRQLRVVRHDPHLGEVAGAGHRRDRDHAEEEPWRHRFVEHRRPVQRHLQPRIRPAVREVATADHQRHRLRVAPNPPRDTAEARSLPVLARRTGGLGRQRPAFTQIPVGRLDDMPVHFVRTRAAEQDGLAKRPAVQHRALRVLEEREIAARRVGNEPHGLAPAGIPVLHHLEPLVLGRRGETLGERRQLVAHPLERPPHVVVVAAMHRQHRRGRQRRPVRLHRQVHVGEHAGGRRVHRGEAVHRAVADDGAADDQPEREADGRRTRQGRSPAHRQERHRNDERQRVACGDGLLEEQVEHQVGAERHQQRDQRATRTPREHDDAGRRQQQHRDRQRPFTPGSDEVILHRQDRLPHGRGRGEHGDTGQVLRPLAVEHLQIRCRSARDEDERHEPGGAARAVRHERPRRALDPQAGAQTQHGEYQQRHGQPDHLRPDASGTRREEGRDGESGEATRGDQHRLHAERGRKPGHVAQGPGGGEPEQRRGGDDERRERNERRVGLLIVERREQPHAGQQRKSASEDAEQAECVHLRQPGHM